MSSTPAKEILQLLQESRQASYAMATLTTEAKNKALEVFAQLIEGHQERLLTENRKDLEREAEQLSPALYQRLKLDAGKLTQLAQGLRDLVRLPDPVGHVLAKTLLDEGLVLEKITVPLGVLAVIFESRPDVMPQVLALALKSGNAIVLKGGKEATRSNQAFMGVLAELQQNCPFLPKGWAQLLPDREAVQTLLHHPEYVDLVIPRGSNELVQSIMATTRIPVMGHAAGVCHLYVHESADIEAAIAVILDAKAQYPAACNAVETLLLDHTIAERFLPRFSEVAASQGIVLNGCEQCCQIVPGMKPATVSDWLTEYGDLTLSMKVVLDLEEAVQHINEYGSHHTDGILATNHVVMETFLNQVDSANVYANASTRFADGFRYGLGAEVGISTAKTHARGPVGLEGLVLYKYKLRGQHHTVAPYVGETAKPFLHQPFGSAQ